MLHLIASVLKATWRSFKVFSDNGSIRLSSAKRFKEITIDANGTLCCKSYGDHFVSDITKTDQWMVVLKNKKHFLEIHSKPVYEIITVNHTVMVLYDLHCQEKIFFSRMEYWEQHLKTNRVFIL
jgi:hypothetical protein